MVTADGHLKVSIITVCRNEADRIERTAESIVSQTCPDFEWIVKDGGSTDGTQDILKRYRRKMSHWESGPDEGVYHAMNCATRRAGGEWLLFMNGGDALAGPDVLKNVVPCLTGGANDIIVGAHLNVWPDGREPIVKMPRGLKHPRGLLDRDQLYRRTINHQSAFIGRAVYERFGPYDESFRILGDYDFFVRAMLGGTEFRCISTLVAEYDMTGMSAAMKGSTLKKWEGMRVRSRFPVRFRLRRSLGTFFVVRSLKRIVR